MKGVSARLAGGGSLRVVRCGFCRGRRARLAALLGRGVDVEDGLAQVDCLVVERHDVESARGDGLGQLLGREVGGVGCPPAPDGFVLDAVGVVKVHLVSDGGGQCDFKVRNNTKETVTFTIEDLPSGFSVSPAGAVTLGPGQSQVMTLTFAPASAVQVDTRIRISSTALDTPLYVNLKGTGVETGAVTTYSVNGVSFNMVTMPAGSFMMGFEEYSNMSPVHRVSLSSFQLGQTEVTQALWEAVMGSNPSTFQGNTSRPVETVDWYDAQRFIGKLNKLTGLQFRLPTEAEWEYAMREAGTSSINYLDEAEMLNQGWFSVNADRPQPVGLKQINAVGLYDMIGNVSEWCFDYYGAFSAEDQTDPRGVAGASEHAFRGISYAMSAGHPLAFRNDAYWGYGLQAIGLRLALGGGAPAPSPQAVDLGLKVKWASFNIGAYRPAEEGGYFAWGETSPRMYDFEWNQYKLLLPGGYDYSTISKYTVEDGEMNGAWYSEGNFVGDGLTVLEPEDDAAHVLWGESWRMPTKEDFHELIDDCFWQWTALDGMPGMQVTGPSGASIFLPAPGFFIGYGRYSAFGGAGVYQSSSLSSRTWAQTELVFSNGVFSLDTSGERSYGYLIRPVCP